jgi:anaerobic selenocysteine-containing dehydrogenase
MDGGLWINSATAKSLGISNGDLVKVQSPYGSLQVNAKVVQGIRADTVGMAHGRGVQNPQADPYALNGSNDNQLSMPATSSDHLQWYMDKEEPYGTSRIVDFTVSVSKVT